jgi:hypothetical protein
VNGVQSFDGLNEERFDAVLTSILDRTRVIDWENTEHLFIFGTTEMTKNQTRSTLKKSAQSSVRPFFEKMTKKSQKSPSLSPNDRKPDSTISREMPHPCAYRS